MGDGTGHPGLIHVGHGVALFEKAAGEGAGAVVGVPVEGGGQQQALRHLQAQSVDVADGQQQGGKLAVRRQQPEFIRLTDGVGGIGAGRGQGQHLGVRPHRLHQVGREVAVVDGEADAAADAAARGPYHRRHLAFEGVAEGVVGGDEVPALEAGRQERRAGDVGEGIGVVGPVQADRGAGGAREFRTGGSGEDDDAVFLLRHLLHRQRHAGVGDVDNQAHALVVPASSDGGAKFGIAAVVGGEHLDRTAVDPAAEVFHCHLCRQHRSVAGVAGVGTAEVGEHADAKGCANSPGPGGDGDADGEQCEDGDDDEEPPHPPGPCRRGGQSRPPASSSPER